MSTGAGVEYVSVESGRVLFVNVTGDRCRQHHYVTTSENRSPVTLQIRTLSSPQGSPSAHAFLVDRLSQAPFKRCVHGLRALDVGPQHAFKRVTGHVDKEYARGKVGESLDGDDMAGGR